jgi:hypothetical protein
VFFVECTDDLRSIIVSSNNHVHGTGLLPDDSTVFEFSLGHSLFSYVNYRTFGCERQFAALWRLVVRSVWIRPRSQHGGSERAEAKETRDSATARTV